MNPSLILVGNIDAITLQADEFGIRTHDLGIRIGLSAKLTTFFWRPYLHVDTEEIALMLKINFEKCFDFTKALIC